MNLDSARTRSSPRGSYEEYHPYGSTAWWAGSSALVSQKRYRFTGMERDDETGLQCHGVRYYAVWLGRWVSADPIGLGDGVNRFGYCHGGVIGGRDATGQGKDLPAEAEARQVLDEQSHDTEVVLEGVPIRDPALQGAVGAESAWNATARLTLYVPRLSAITASIPAGKDLDKLSDLELRSLAESAYNERNSALKHTRAVLTSAGTAVSVAVKPVEPPLPGLQQKYAVKRLQGSAALQAKFGVTGLAVESQEFQAAARTLQGSREVSLEVMRAAGRSNVIFTVGAAGMSVAGSVMLVLGVKHSIDEVRYAPEGEKLYTAGREASTWAGARLGAAYAGDAALLAAPRIASVIPEPRLRAAAAIAVGGGMVLGGAWAGATLARNTYQFAFASP